MKASIPTKIALVTGAGSGIGRTFGRLDLLFNNADINAPAMPIDELPLDTYVGRG